MSQFDDDVLMALKHFSQAKDLTPEQDAAAVRIARRLNHHECCPQEYLDNLRADAIAEYGSNDVAIDPLTGFDISEADNGTWVRAWVWLSDEEKEEEEEEE